MASTFKRIVLERYPAGVPAPGDFRVEDVSLPTPADGEVLIRNFLVSVDPGMRNRLTDAYTYAPPIPLGGTIEGASIGTVVESKNPKFAVGDVVAAALGWTEYGVSNGRGLMKLAESDLPWSTALGVLGIPGLTAYFGLHRVGKIAEGESVLVSSAAGPVGATAVQLAKLHGCRVVGIAGGPAKCAWVRDELGADDAIDYKAATDLSQAVAERLADGVDVYFDNVGNAFIDAALPHMNAAGRIVISGQVAEYNVPPEQRTGIRHTLEFITKRLRMEGFVVIDDVREFAAARERIAAWVRQGKLVYKEEFFDGIEAAPAAFIGLFHGENFGRRLVRVAPEPPRR